MAVWLPLPLPLAGLRNAKHNAPGSQCTVHKSGRPFAFLHQLKRQKKAPEKSGRLVACQPTQSGRCQAFSRQ